MKNENKILWEILVPAEMDSSEIPVAYHRKWDDKVREISNGLTILKTAKGQWISSTGKLFSEKMIPVRIACTEKEIEDIMAITAKYYQQEEVLAYKIAESVKFYKNKDNLGLGFREVETRKAKELV